MPPSNDGQKKGLLAAYARWNHDREVRKLRRTFEKLLATTKGTEILKLLKFDYVRYNYEAEVWKEAIGTRLNVIVLDRIKQRNADLKPENTVEWLTNCLSEQEIFYIEHMSQAVRWLVVNIGQQLAQTFEDYAAILDTDLVFDRDLKINIFRHMLTLVTMHEQANRLLRYTIEEPEEEVHYLAMERVVSMRRDELNMRARKQ